MEFEEFKSNFTVLIVDDNEDNVYTLQHLLQRAGYRALLTAKNGVEALERIKENPVQLVLLDLMMPEMSGHEVLAHLKDKIFNHEISVLMVSSTDRSEDVIESIKSGADDFLSKPFNPHILRARMGACLEKHWHLYLEKNYKKQIEQDKKRYIELLNSVFPASVAHEMIETGTVKTRSVEGVVILFADIVDFTHYTEKHEPNEVLENLQFFIDVCEAAASQYKIEKIKTIGDSFMAASGMLEKIDLPVLASVNWAVNVINRMKDSPSKWEVRVGIDVGDVICGIIGHREYLFDVWGNCVNTASRVQSLAKPNTIYLTESAWLTIANSTIQAELAGEFSVKGKDQPYNLYEVIPPLSR